MDDFNDRRDNVAIAIGKIMYHMDEVHSYFTTIPNPISFCCSHQLVDTFRLRLLLIADELAVIDHPNNDIGICPKIPNLEKILEAREIVGSTAFVGDQSVGTDCDSVTEYIWTMWTREIPALRSALTGISIDNSRIAAVAQNTRERMAYSQEADRTRWLKKLIKNMNDEENGE